jgi:hypothetical protein
VPSLALTCGRLWYRLNCPEMLLSKVRCSQILTLLPHWRVCVVDSTAIVMVEA